MSGLVWASIWISVAAIVVTAASFFLEWWWSR